MNTNDASDPNPVTDTGTNATPHVALENNSDQLDQFANGDFPSPDFVDQAIEVATTLYIESNGVYNTNPYAAASTINGISYSAVKVRENGFSPTTGNLLQNTLPDRTDPVQHLQLGHGAGLDRWLPQLGLRRQLELLARGSTTRPGMNFDAELTNIIGSVFGFPRLTDAVRGPGHRHSG